LGDLFIQGAQIAQKSKPVKLEQIAIGGTKTKANAWKRSSMSYARMEKGENRLTRLIN